MLNFLTHLWILISVFGVGLICVSIAAAILLEGWSMTAKEVIAYWLVLLVGAGLIALAVWGFVYVGNKNDVRFQHRCDAVHGKVIDDYGYCIQGKVLFS